MPKKTKKLILSKQTAKDLKSALPKTGIKTGAGLTDTTSGNSRCSPIAGGAGSINY